MTRAKIPGPRPPRVSLYGSKYTPIHSSPLAGPAPPLRFPRVMHRQSTGSSGLLSLDNSRVLFQIMRDTPFPSPSAPFSRKDEIHLISSEIRHIGIRRTVFFPPFFRLSGFRQSPAIICPNLSTTLFTAFSRLFTDLCTASCTGLGTGFAPRKMRRPTLTTPRQQARFSLFRSTDIHE